MQSDSEDVRRLIKKLVKEIVGKHPARRNLTVLPDDVFLVSYPRSGNTWLRFLLSNLVYGVEVNFDTVGDYIPDIYRQPNRSLMKYSSPRMLKSHEPYDDRYPKVIYVVRDGRDVACSEYFYFRKFKAYSGDIDSFMLNFTAGRLHCFGTWGSHTLGWLEHKSSIPGGFMFVKYEDMKADMKKVVSKLCNFLDLDRSDTEIDKAISSSSFSRMRKIEERTESESQLLSNTNTQLKFVRSGSKGDWQKIFTDRAKELFKISFGYHLVHLGYESDLDW